MRLARQALRSVQVMATLLTCLAAGVSVAQGLDQLPEGLRKELTDDSHIIDLIKHNIQSNAALGIKLPGKPFKVGLKEVYDRALSSHTVYRRTQQDDMFAAASMELAQSVFDTTLGLRLAHTQTSFNERSELITRERETDTTLAGNPTGEDAPEESGDVFLTDENGERIPIDDIGRLGCVVVNGEVLNPDHCSVTTEIGSEREFASVKSDVSPESDSLVLEVSKIVPWGGNFIASLQTNKRIKAFYSSNSRLERFIGDADDPVGTGSNYPWTSNFSLSFSTPLPKSKDYGEYGFGPMVGERNAGLGYEMAQLQIEDSANDILAQVDAAFSALLKQQANMVFSANQVSILSAIADSSRRLYEQRSITSYDLAQIEAEFEQARINAELAWHDYLQNSNELAFLLNLDSDIYLIADINADSFGADAAPAAPSNIIDVNRHPAVMAANKALQQAEGLLRHGEAQLRPDLRFVFNINYSQSDQVFGYESWGDSLDNVFDPDTRSFFLGVSYQVNFGRRGVKSRWSQSRIRRQQADHGLSLARNNVLAEINSASASLATLERIVTNNGESLKLAELAYDKASRLRRQGVITEFERLRAMQERYRSSLAYFSSTVDYRTARNRLLAVNGTLFRHYQARRNK